ncbi:hypothetical protein AOC36_03050 [Erysipelothrix larvae]|uniref:Uncharacterized protein n=1 Tax=Erysipelothrix larvae TaxID=1514105 RepID=A0A0X8GYY1_9FIRM|nr:hypothetical protein [Erysipelothrix larvae]AMC92995.1 hypothetical protein AOC36_03050 [Erysipelothrix larvae]
MAKLTSKILKIVNDENIYLMLVCSLFIFVPAAYLLYLSMSVYALNTNLSTLLNNSSVESINLIVNISSIYSAFVIFKIREKKEYKNEMIAFAIVFVSQIILMNQLAIMVLFFYIYNFIGIKNIKKHYIKANKSKDKKIILLALFVLLIAMTTLIIKIKIGMI